MMSTTDNAPALVLQDVCKVKGTGHQAVTLLDAISLSLPAGQLTALVGPSGGGKSTLLRLLNRLDEATSGQILYRGAALSAMEPVALRRAIGMVMQKPVMFAGSVLDNLQHAFVLRKAPVPGADSALLQQTLEQCELEAALLGRNAQSLSVGQQQRVSLARTLITGPDILLLDEPTSALDRPTGDLLAATLLNICRERGLTLIMATHDLRLAGQIADHLVYLEAGQVVEQGPPAALLKNPRTRQLRKFLAEPDFSGKGTGND
jgi:putative ABC transport system ATP-binding protein